MRKDKLDAKNILFLQTLEALLSKSYNLLIEIYGLNHCFWKMHWILCLNHFSANLTNCVNLPKAVLYGLCSSSSDPLDPNRQKENTCKF